MWYYIGCSFKKCVAILRVSPHSTHYVQSIILCVKQGQFQRQDAELVLRWSTQSQTSSVTLFTPCDCLTAFINLEDILCSTGKLYFKAQQFEKFSSIHVVEVIQMYGSDSWKMVLVLSWFQDISHYLKLALSRRTQNDLSSKLSSWDLILYIFLWDFIKMLKAWKKNLLRNN